MKYLALSAAWHGLLLGDSLCLELHITGILVVEFDQLVGRHHFGCEVSAIDGLINIGAVFFGV